MNPRRVHALMRKHFPPVDAVNRDWIVVADANNILLRQRLEDLLDAHIKSEDVLVQVYRKLGDFFSKAQALDFVAGHVCKSDIKIADRGFVGFVYVALNGVATGWSVSPEELL